MVTWQTDNTVSVYVLTPSQFDSSKLLGIPFSSLAREQMTSSGSLSYQIPNSGTYYVAITPYISDVNVASYKSDLQWQEEVTKYRTETHYRTETVYNSSVFGINLGISILVLGSVVTALSFVNIKPLMFKAKTLNNSTCAYCGTIYDKNLDKCPHCGARKKASL